MLKMKELFEKDPSFVPNIHFSHEIHAFQDFDQRMTQALGCAELMAEKGLDVYMCGDVSAQPTEPEMPILLEEGKCIELDLKDVSVWIEGSINTKSKLYEKMQHVLLEIRRQQSRITGPSKATFSLGELGFDTSNEQELRAVEQWLDRRLDNKISSPKP